MPGVVYDLHHYRQTVAALDQCYLPRDAGAQDDQSLPCIACAALRTMLSMTCINCSLSPTSAAG